jgi:hypothetical protein
MKSYERGLQLLGELGKPAARPKPVADKPAMSVCKYCDAVVTWAATPSMKRVPLDMHPEGSIVVRDGVAVELPPNDGERKYVMHFKACREARDGRKTP